jgi:hypothetical protein
VPLPLVSAGDQNYSFVFKFTHRDSGFRQIASGDSKPGGPGSLSEAA